MIRPIYAIANDIERDMRSQSATGKPAAMRFLTAWPYLQAAKQLDKITDTYGADSAKSVVLYLLSNLSTYRGEKARTFKAELKEIAK